MRLAVINLEKAACQSPGSVPPGHPALLKAAKSRMAFVRFQAGKKEDRRKK